MGDSKLLKKFWFQPLADKSWRMIDDQVKQLKCVNLAVDQTL
jgi:hypothetical protein